MRRPHLPAILVASMVALLGVLAVPGAALGHELWLEPAATGFVLRYGHHGGEELPIAAAKVKSIRCSDGRSAARELLGKASFQPRAVTVPGPCAVISAVFHGGTWVLTPDGEKNLPRTQAPDAVKSWESRELTKWVDVHSPAAATPIGDELEIVPVTDLARVKTDDKIAVRVLLDGKPVRGAIVGYGEKPIGETDSAGETRVRLRAPGLQVLTATLRRPLGRPEADVQVLQANLTFQVAR